MPQISVMLSMPQSKDQIERDRKKAIDMLRLVFPEFEHIDADELLGRISAKEFFAQKGVTNDMNRLYRRVKKIHALEVKERRRREEPELLEFLDLLSTTIPELKDTGFLFKKRLLGLDKLRRIASKNQVVIDQIEAHSAEEHRPSSEELFLTPAQLQDFPISNILDDSEYNMLRGVRQSQSEHMAGRSNYDLVRLTDVDTFSQFAKIGARKAKILNSLRLKMLTLSEEQRIKICEFFGVDAAKCRLHFAGQSSATQRIEEALLDAFRYMPLAKRLVYCKAFGVNSQKINHKVIGIEINVTESRISQIVKEITSYVRHFLSDQALQQLRSDFRSIQAVFSYPRLAEIFSSKRLFYRFLGDICDPDGQLTSEWPLLHRNSIYDALAQWGQSIPHDEFDRYLLDHFGYGIHDLYDPFLSQDLVDDDNIVITPTHITVKSLPHRFLIGAIASHYVDGIDASALLKEVESSPLYENPKDIVLSETFRKSQYLFTIDKSFYKHQRFYDPNDRELQVVIRQIFPIVREPKPDHVKTIYDLYAHVPKARYMSQYLFCHVFRHACETVDFDIHPSYFEFVSKPSEVFNDEDIVAQIKAQRKPASRSSLAETFHFELRYMTMRLSQLVRAKKIIRINRETYDLRERALKDIDVASIRQFIEEEVKSHDQMMDFSYLTRIINKKFGFSLRKEFYHSLYVHEMQESGLYLNRYLLHTKPVPYTSLRGLVNSLFDPELSDKELLKKIEQHVLVSPEMHQTMLKVWVHYLRINDQRKRRLLAS